MQGWQARLGANQERLALKTNISPETQVWAGHRVRKPSEQ